MKIKTNELIGPALDWVVAKCNGDFALYHNIEEGQRFLNLWTGSAFLKYSTLWSCGGPIVEKELINLITTAGYPWRATMYMGGGVWIDQHGPTPLIAAMRCYCCAKLGDEIEIPQELQPCQQPKT